MTGTQIQHSKNAGVYASVFSFLNLGYLGFLEGMKASWGLNQPSWNICERQIRCFPQGFGVNILTNIIATCVKSFIIEVSHFTYTTQKVDGDCQSHASGFIVARATIRKLLGVAGHQLSRQYICTIQMLSTKGVLFGEIEELHLAPLHLHKTNKTSPQIRVSQKGGCLSIVSTESRPL